MTVQPSIPPNALPHLREWAKRRVQPVTVFDLETTTNIPHVKWMGVTELGLMTISPTGVIETVSAFVDPERNIPPKVRELTGIQNEDVEGQPTWAAWAKRLDQYAREHVMVGYNSSGFDCIVVINQNARYGVENTEFQYSLDVMGLPDVQGKLGDVCRQFGITSDTYHRALADVWLTARLADKIAELQGLDVLDSLLGKVAQGQGYSPRKLREEELLAAYRDYGKLPDLEEFGAKHGIKRGTAEGDIERLIDAGEIPLSLLEDRAIQDWLAPRLSEAIRSCWVGDAEGRLKPLMLHLQEGAPDGFDYTQLRLGIARWKDKQAEG